MLSIRFFIQLYFFLIFKFKFYFIFYFYFSPYVHGLNNLMSIPPTQDNLQIQCQPYQNSSGILLLLLLFFLFFKIFIVIQLQLSAFSPDVPIFTICPPPPSPPPLPYAIRIPLSVFTDD